MGRDVQDMGGFYTLGDIGGVKDYNKADEKLNEYFVPQVNSA